MTMDNKSNSTVRLGKNLVDDKTASTSNQNSSSNIETSGHLQSPAFPNVVVESPKQMSVGELRQWLARFGEEKQAHFQRFHQQHQQVQQHHHSRPSSCPPATASQIQDKEDKDSVIQDDGGESVEDGQEECHGRREDIIKDGSPQQDNDSDNNNKTKGELLPTPPTAPHFVTPPPSPVPFSSSNISSSSSSSSSSASSFRASAAASEEEEDQQVKSTLDANMVSKAVKNNKPSVVATRSSAFSVVASSSSLLPPPSFRSSRMHQNGLEEDSYLGGKNRASVPSLPHSSPLTARQQKMPKTSTVHHHASNTSAAATATAGNDENGFPSVDATAAVQDDDEQAAVDLEQYRIVSIQGVVRRDGSVYDVAADHDDGTTGTRTTTSNTTTLLEISTDDPTQHNRSVTLASLSSSSSSWDESQARDPSWVTTRKKKTTRQQLRTTHQRHRPPSATTTTALWPCLGDGGFALLHDDVDQSGLPIATTTSAGSKKNLTYHQHRRNDELIAATFHHHRAAPTARQRQTVTLLTASASNANATRSQSVTETEHQGDDGADSWTASGYWTDPGDISSSLRDKIMRKLDFEKDCDEYPRGSHGCGYPTSLSLPSCLLLSRRRCCGIGSNHSTDGRRASDTKTRAQWDMFPLCGEKPLVTRKLQGHSTNDNNNRNIPMDERDRPSMASSNDWAAATESIDSEERELVAANSRTFLLPHHHHHHHDKATNHETSSTTDVTSVTTGGSETILTTTMRNVYTPPSGDVLVRPTSVSSSTTFEQEKSGGRSRGVQPNTEMKNKETAKDRGNHENNRSNSVIVVDRHHMDGAQEDSSSLEDSTDMLDSIFRRGNDFSGGNVVKTRARFYQRLACKGGGDTSIDNLQQQHVQGRQRRTHLRHAPSEGSSQDAAAANGGSGSPMSSFSWDSEQPADAAETLATSAVAPLYASSMGDVFASEMLRMQDDSSVVPDKNTREPPSVPVSLQRTTRDEDYSTNFRGAKKNSHVREIVGTLSASPHSNHAVDPVIERPRTRSCVAKVHERWNKNLKEMTAPSSTTNMLLNTKTNHAVKVSSGNNGTTKTVETRAKTKATGIASSVSSKSSSSSSSSRIQRRLEELEEKWAANRAPVHVRKVKWQPSRTTGVYKKKVVIDVADP